MWERLRPGEPGFTYDGPANAMLGPYNRLQSRVDRALVRLLDWRPSAAELVGTRPLPGVTYYRTYRQGVRQLPVLPSDHFGLYMEFEPCA